MKRFILAAGAAALAISAPAASQPGNKGGGDKGRPAAAKVQKDRGGGKAAQKRGGERKVAQSRGGERKAMKQRSSARDKAVAQARKADNRRGETRARAAENRAKQHTKAVREARKADERRIDRVREARADRIERIRDDRRVALRDHRIDRDDRVAVGYGVGGCPPGLLSKGCVPPGQAKNFIGEPVSVVSQRVAFRDLPDKLRYVYQDTPDHYYRYGDGYVYRINRQNDVVSSLLPLFGLGLTAGQMFPSTYSNHYLPTGLQSFYPDSPYTSYRYANGYVYQVDPITGLIEDVDPMLGYGYGYGQMMPATYSAYNVPYQYRPLYADTSNYHYRYAPGAIYQVDPQTSLITAVAALLTGGFNVGQPLPAGYGVYNVPYGYRDQYYDTPNDWYRYANGSIYRVDPTTQLVTALVTSVLT